jgi:hypothetical protein
MTLFVTRGLPSPEKPSGTIRKIPVALSCQAVGAYKNLPLLVYRDAVGLDGAVIILLLLAIEADVIFIAYPAGSKEALPGYPWF